MIRLLAATFVLFCLPIAYGLAESCDAGHGCSITCKNGCSAIYNLDTGKCSKKCAPQEKSKRPGTGSPPR